VAASVQELVGELVSCQNQLAVHSSSQSGREQ